jgi:peptidoglycan/LPS O-acetylase OafA/YrhL
MMMNIRENYRPEIDGLRALAVVAVILYHFFPTIMPGGFLGVDIFFVISGYLISKIIAGSLQSNKFSIVDFYVRRIKRIFPALLIVCTVFLIYGWFVLLPEELNQVGRHISYGSIFLSNLALYKDIGYFDVSAAQKPFMHLWSLSVEEQFYLLWPLILLVFYKKWQNRWIVPFIVFAVIISYWLNIFLMSYKPDLAFYFPFSRFWELGAGAFVAYVEPFHKGWKEKFPLGSSFSNLLSLFGFLCLVGSLFFLKRDVPLFPYLTFLPVLGAACIVLITEKTWVSKSLSCRPIVWVGLISYPMYLLHYPLISFVHVVQPALLTTPFKIGLIMIIIGLSWLIYKFVETPIRHHKGRKGAAILLALMALVWGASWLVAHKHVKPFAYYRLPQIVNILDAFDDFHYPSKEMVTFESNGAQFYRLGNGKETVAFFGDSNMYQYAPRINEIFIKNPHLKKSAVFAALGNLCPIPDVGDSGHLERFSGHKSFRDAFLQYSFNENVKEIVISGAWFSYFNGSPFYYLHNDQQHGLHTQEGLDKALDAFKAMIKTWVARGKKVYLVLPMPSGSGYDVRTMFTRNLLGDWGYTSSGVSMQEWEKTSRRIRGILREVASSTGASVINPDGDLCSNGQCRFFAEDGMCMYKDAGHLSTSWVKDNVRFFDFLFHD